MFNRRLKRQVKYLRAQSDWLTQQSATMSKFIHDHLMTKATNIKIGDTVYSGMVEYTVVRIENNDVQVVRTEGTGFADWFSAEYLTVPRKNIR